jgi:hypothetical protein
MTMLVRTLAGLAGVAALFAGAQVARAADDVIPLRGAGSSSAATITLGYDGKADTELARYARGGYGGYRGGHYGGYGGYRGGHYGGYGGYRGAYYGGYRGGHYGGYRGYYAGYGGYRGYYGGYYRPYYYGNYGGYYPYYSSYYYSPSYYYSTPYYDYGYYGCNTGVVAAPSVYAYQQPYYPSVQPYGVQGQVYGNYNGYSGVPQQNGVTQPMPPVQPPNGNGTFPYDGGPNNPVPMPRQDATPAKSAPQAPTTLRLVSAPSQPVRPATQFSFQAYGEDTRASGFATDRTATTKKTTR